MDAVLKFYPFKIRKTLTDNGLGFSNHILNTQKNSAFTLLCKINEIKHITTKPKHLFTNGMVERVNRTIKRFDFENYNHLQENLNKFLFKYNFEKPHKSLKQEINRFTPFEALVYFYQKKKKSTNNLFKPYR